MTIGKFDLIYSLSLLYPVQMKMQLSFFCRKRIFLKKKAGYGCTFHFRPIVFVQGFGKNALGNSNKVKGESNHVHALVRVLIRESV